MQIVDILTRLLIDPATQERLAGRGAAGWRGLIQALGGHFHELSLYNPLGLASGIVFFATIFHPWWYSGIYGGAYTIRAFPYLLRHNLPPEGLTYVIETPVIAVIVLFLLLCGYLLLAFWGSTMAGRKGRLFLLWNAICMLLYTVGFYLALLYACSRSGLPVVGQSQIQYTVPVDVVMYFLPPYRVAIAAGVAGLLSPLLHGLVTLPPVRERG